MALGHKPFQLGSARSAVPRRCGAHTAEHGDTLTRRSPVRLPRAPGAIPLRTFRRRLRHVVRRPFARWIAREPEIVVRVPPLDEALTAAVKLIAPQYHWLQTDERSRAFWERDQNSSCWIEDAALAPVLRAMPRARRVLEIGPGLGRSAVFFSRRYFSDARFDLFDATGYRTKYETLGPRYEDSFCGNLPLLQRCLEFNGMTNYAVLDASTTGGHLETTGGTYDFIYSFYAVGFHWSVDHWLDEILRLAHDSTLCAFIVPNRYRPSPRIAAMPHVLLEAAPPLRPCSWRTTYVLAFTPTSTSWPPV